MGIKRRNVKSAAIDAHERAKDYLDEVEIDRLFGSAKNGRHGVRDHLLLFMIYRHALRVSEAVAMRLDQINLKQARVWVRRSKNSLDTEQSIEGDELRAIKRYIATRKDKLPWLFISERRLRDFVSDARDLSAPIFEGRTKTVGSCFRDSHVAHHFDKRIFTEWLALLCARKNYITFRIKRSGFDQYFHAPRTERNHVGLSPTAAGLHTCGRN